MNKKMIFAAIAAIATMSGIVGFNLQKQESSINALTLANIEALSEDESEDGWTEIHESWSEDRNYADYTRHFTYHRIICIAGGPVKDCIENEWTTFYDTKS